MKKLKLILVLALSITMLDSCMIIRQGEVGVKRKLGKVNYVPLDQGPRFFNPFLTSIFKVPVNTVNMEVVVPLPSREGLTISAEVSILYRLQKSEVPRIFDEIGMRYERTVLLPVFRSAVADVSSQYYAKDMHSGARAEIEENIRETMMKVLGPKGFIIENVLLKTIRLPDDLGRAIEEKLRAEQEAQRMEFTKQHEVLEAERLLIAAEGEQKAKIARAEGSKRVAEIDAEGDANAIKIRAKAQAEANEMISQSLTPTVLRNNQIEAFRQLSGSQNSKIIITDGKTPLLGIPTN
ncbi:MAG: prohibitin family protein [Cryomorphaceae bacterium]|nr:prohibitin family protein [Cryomorphaceae bacterium]